MVVLTYRVVRDKYDTIRTETSSFFVTNLIHTRNLFWNCTFI